VVGLCVRTEENGLDFHGNVARRFFEGPSGSRKKIKLPATNRKLGELQGDRACHGAPGATVSGCTDALRKNGIPGRSCELRACLEDFPESLGPVGFFSLAATRSGTDFHENSGEKPLEVDDR